MSIGLEHDDRQYRRLKKTDYYEAKAAEEQYQKTRFDKCELCGREITGKSYYGSKSGKFICQECWNEKAI